MKMSVMSYSFVFGYSNMSQDFEEPQEGNELLELHRFFKVAISLLLDCGELLHGVALKLR